MNKPKPQKLVIEDGRSHATPRLILITWRGADVYEWIDKNVGEFGPLLAPNSTAGGMPVNKEHGRRVWLIVDVAFDFDETLAWLRHGAALLQGEGSGKKEVKADGNAYVITGASFRKVKELLERHPSVCLSALLTPEEFLGEAVKVDLVAGWGDEPKTWRESRPVQRMTLREAEVSRCPECGSENFARSSGEPMTISGWYGQRYCQWVDEGNNHHAIVTSVRCADCQHVELLRKEGEE